MANHAPNTTKRILAAGGLALGLGSLGLFASAGTAAADGLDAAPMGSWPADSSWTRVLVASVLLALGVRMRFAWPLTGHSCEMRLIAIAISASDLSGIVVCGAAGVGKSRIAREALSSAASNGCEIRWAIGTSSARALPLVLSLLGQSRLSPTVSSLCAA